MDLNWILWEFLGIVHDFVDIIWEFLRIVGHFVDLLGFELARFVFCGVGMEVL